jgi:hypothetical protein
LDQAVDSLPKQCKNVYKLSRDEGLTNKEIATNLLISERAVEYHISKALSVIKIRLKKYCNINIARFLLITFVLLNIRIIKRWKSTKKYLKNMLQVNALAEKHAVEKWLDNNSWDSIAENNHVDELVGSDMWNKINADVYRYRKFHWAKITAAAAVLVIGFLFSIYLPLLWIIIPLPIHQLRIASSLPKIIMIYS